MKNLRPPSTPSGLSSLQSWRQTDETKPPHKIDEVAASHLAHLQQRFEQEMQARAGAPLADADLEHFSREHLRIRTKQGAILPLRFNRAQRYIHDQLEAQKAAGGRVRALILKGRQQGCSTYVAARFYHRCGRNTGMRVFILTHEEQATKNLFEMVERYHDNCTEALRPSTGAANAKELYFDQLDSGYKVGT